MDVEKRITAAWQGRISGCLLGKPVEGMSMREGKDFMENYVSWEMGMLTELGFGLDLSACAATGSKDQLIYVSPKSGQAVSKSAGKPHQ